MAAGDDPPQSEPIRIQLGAEPADTASVAVTAPAAGASGWVATDGAARGQAAAAGDAPAGQGNSLSFGQDLRHSQAQWTHPSQPQPAQNRAEQNEQGPALTGWTKQAWTKQGWTPAQPTAAPGAQATQSASTVAGGEWRVTSGQRPADEEDAATRGRTDAETHAMGPKFPNLPILKSPNAVVSGEWRVASSESQSPKKDAETESHGNKETAADESLVTPSPNPQIPKSLNPSIDGRVIPAAWLPTPPPGAEKPPAETDPAGKPPAGSKYILKAGPESVLKAGPELEHEPTCCPLNTPKPAPRPSN